MTRILCGGLCAAVCLIAAMPAVGLSQAPSQPSPPKVASPTTTVDDCSTPCPPIATPCPQPCLPCAPRIVVSCPPPQIVFRTVPAAKATCFPYSGQTPTRVTHTPCLTCSQVQSFAAPQMVAAPQVSYQLVSPVQTQVMMMPATTMFAAPQMASPQLISVPQTFTQQVVATPQIVAAPQVTTQQFVATPQVATQQFVAAPQVATLQVAPQVVAAPQVATLQVAPQVVAAPQQVTTTQIVGTVQMASPQQFVTVNSAQPQLVVQPQASASTQSAQLQTTQQVQACPEHDLQLAVALLARARMNMAAQSSGTAVPSSTSASLQSTTPQSTGGEDDAITRLKKIEDRLELHSKAINKLIELQTPTSPAPKRN